MIASWDDHWKRPESLWIISQKVNPHCNFLIKLIKSAIFFLYPDFPSYHSFFPPLWFLALILRKMKEESEKSGLKLNIQKTRIIAFSPITSWQIDGETMGMVTDFIFGGSKIAADGDCSHEIKRCVFLGRCWKKSYDQPRQHIKKQRHYFADKGLSSQS